MVPSDAATVVVFNHLSRTAENLTRFVEKIGGNSTDLPPDRLIESLGFKPGSVNTTRPFVLVFREAGFETNDCVLIFQPTEPPTWTANDASTAETGGDVRKVSLGAQRPVFGVSRGDWVIAGPSRRLVRRIAHSKARPLSGVIDATQQRMLTNSDVAAHFSIKAWRDKIRQSLVFVKMVAVGAAAFTESEDAQTQRAGLAIWDWMLKGLDTLFDDMRSTTLALSMEDEGFRLQHNHDFQPDRPSGQYLLRGKRSGVDAWRGAQAQPFVCALVMDWRCPGDHSIVRSMMESVMHSPESMKNITTREAESVLARCDRLSDLTLSSSWVVHRTAEGPIEIQGQYHFKDAADGLKQLLEAARESTAMAEALLPGWKGYQKINRVRRGALDVYEMKLSPDGDSEAVKKIKKIYGSDAMCQMAALNEHLVTYSVSANVEELPRLAEQIRAGRNNLTNEPRVQQLLKHLPRDAGIVAMVDVNELTRVVPHLSGNAPSSQPIATGEPADPNGPLAGWAMEVRGASLMGEAYISQADVIRSVASFKHMAREMEKQHDARKPAGRVKIKIQGREKVEASE